jgi:hypothetical protein
MKIKEWPIVLTCSLQYGCRTGERLAMLPFYSLDRLKDPEAVKMCDTQCETINTRDEKRSDFLSCMSAKEAAKALPAMMRKWGFMISPRVCSRTRGPSRPNMGRRSQSEIMPIRRSADAPPL